MRFDTPVSRYQVLRLHDSKFPQASNKAGSFIAKFTF